jgi:hypothetical protein
MHLHNLSFSQMSVRFAHIHGSTVNLHFFQQILSLSLIPQAEERHVGGLHFGEQRSNIHDYAATAKGAVGICEIKFEIEQGGFAMFDVDVISILIID